MAFIAALALVGDPLLWKKVRGVYTYGQPMVIEAGEEEKCRKLIGAALYRHVYFNDIVPHLPPLSTGNFDHVGEEYRWRPKTSWELQKPHWLLFLSNGRVTQVPFILSTAPFALLDALLPNFPLVDNIKMWWSFIDHSPVGYMSTLNPSD